jgi:hypothetical protein
MRTLDLVGKDPNDYRVWTAGLRELLKKFQEGKIDQHTKEMLIELPILKGRRSSVDIRDIHTGLTSNEIGGESTEKKRKQREGNTNSKANTKELLAKFVKLQKAVNDKTASLKKAKYIHTAQYTNMKTILARCILSVTQINEMVQDGRNTAADNEIWRANVDVEALTEMMKVVRAL